MIIIAIEFRLHFSFLVDKDNYTKDEHFANDAEERPKGGKFICRVVRERVK